MMRKDTGKNPHPEERPMSTRIALNPTSYPPPPAQRLRHRLAGLAGKTVGLLSNNKTNVDAIFDRLAELLAERFGVRTLRFTKPSPALAAPAEIVRQSLANCDAVLLAIAD
jgi:hypothetical protein